MDEDVVGAAAEFEVVEVGAAALGPGGFVVGVAPAGGAVAAGEDAVAVAGGDGAALGGAGEADAASEVEDLAVGAEDDSA